ncbi:MAG: 4a-hydroxytetrahydrobiopterin dehydratase [Gemmatimonadota bacterium]|nr:4a-hydroxytetrahydrobiopterin dehydratase [Gemmatimonadota bacterium]
MTDLAERHCEACKPDSPTVSPEEREEFHAQVPDWDIVEIGGVPQLQRAFTVPDFAEALALSDEVGALAEEEGHHPAILTEYGKVTVRWWTHTIGGLHKNDFIMAAKTDELFEDL